MSTTESTECNHLKAAVEQMVAHPTLSVKDAMKLADFTLDEREDKNLQHMVLRCLPGKEETLEDNAVALSNSAVIKRQSNVSPLTSSSGSMRKSEDSTQKQKFQRLTVSQKQAQQVRNLLSWVVII
jgi:hypothetical protein